MVHLSDKLHTYLKDNLREYYRMASWVRPGILGSDASFNQRFMKPIEEGMARDAEAEAVAIQVEKSKELYKIMKTFTQRRDNTILKEQLPPLQEAILHVRQSPLQRSLYAAFKKHSCKNDDANYFRLYKAQFLVNNHPGTLLLKKQRGVASKSPSTVKTNSVLGLSTVSASQSDIRSAPSGNTIELLSDTDGEDDCPKDAGSTSKGCQLAFPVKKEQEETIPCADEKISNAEDSWWKPVFRKKEEAFHKIEQGKKIVLLLQILALSQEAGDKVVIFSQSLPTLDYIENILKTEWWVYVRNRNKLSSTLKLGKWENQVDYYRIDGATGASDRGSFVTAFNTEKESKAFLISIEAGGIG